MDGESSIESRLEWIPFRLRSFDSLWLPLLQSESPDGRREMTFIRSGNYTGQLREMIAQLPRDFGILSRIKVRR